MDNSRLLPFPFKILLCLGLILFLAYETNSVWEKKCQSYCTSRISGDPQRKQSFTKQEKCLQLNFNFLIAKEILPRHWEDISYHHHPSAQTLTIVDTVTCNKLVFSAAYPDDQEFSLHFLSKHCYDLSVHQFITSDHNKILMNVYQS